MIEEIRHLMSDPTAILFAVLFVGICVGIGNTISRITNAAQPEPPRSRRNRRI